MVVGRCTVGGLQTNIHHFLVLSALSLSCLLKLPDKRRHKVNFRFQLASLGIAAVLDVLMVINLQA